MASKLLDDNEQWIDRDAEFKLFQSFFQEYETLSSEQRAYSQKGIFIRGEHGTGKTHFVKKALASLNYDTVVYGTTHVRNTGLFTKLATTNMTSCSVLSRLQGQPRRIVLVVDDVQSMITNKSEMEGLGTLIHLISEKKTKKQQKEKFLGIPVVCISSMTLEDVHPKINELENACKTVIQFRTPSPYEMKCLKETHTLGSLSSAIIKTNLNMFRICHNLNQSAVLLNEYKSSNNIGSYIVVKNSNSSVGGSGEKGDMSFNYKLSQHLEIQRQDILTYFLRGLRSIEELDDDSIKRIRRLVLLCDK